MAVRGWPRPYKSNAYLTNRWSKTSVLPSLGGISGPEPASAPGPWSTLPKEWWINSSFPEPTFSCLNIVAALPLKSIRAGFSLTFTVFHPKLELLNLLRVRFIWGSKGSCGPYPCQNDHAFACDSDSMKPLRRPPRAACTPKWKSPLQLTCRSLWPSRLWLASVPVGHVFASHLQRGRVTIPHFTAYKVPQNTGHVIFQP